MTKTALVLGATGGIGSTLARLLHARGWVVRALVRDVTRGMKSNPALAWVAGDAMVPADVLAAAQGASVIVHAVNPPGYRHWETLAMPMLESTVAAAQAVGARIVLPGTIYNFGPDAGTTLREDSPQHPETRKGKIRVEMEQRLAHSGVPVLVVRAGDFFGPGAVNNWFSGCLVAPGAPVTVIRNPAREGVGHQWAYLPDVAETMVRLLERADELPTFAVFHMRGVVDRDGTELPAAIQRAVGGGARMKRFPWITVPLLAPFVPFMRELREMRYLWKQMIVMPNDRLVAMLGKEPSTPLDTAVRETLRGLGCLPASSAHREAAAELA